MVDVTILSSTIIRPENTNQPGRVKIHLTPFDLTLLHNEYPQRGFLLPKPDPEIQFITRLRNSLSSTLTIYFPFAGQLVKVNNLEDKTVSFYFNCNNNSGAKFIHAIAKSITLTDFLQPLVPNFITQFFPPNVKSINGVSEPLLALQVTEIKDGIFIGFGYNHMVSDGSSIWNFINLWSKICFNNHQEIINLQPIVLKNWFLPRINYPIHIPISEIETRLRHEISPISMTKDRVFHFTKKNLSDLKAKANSEIDSSDITISSLQALSAHLWRSIMRNSGLNHEKETYCNVAIDLRQRLKPPLEKECFGNVTNVEVVTVKVGEMLSYGIGWTGLQINKLVRLQTDAKYKVFVENWGKNVEILKKDDRDKSIRVCDFVVISSSPRFKVYENDFGWGKPVAVRAGPGNNMSGKLVCFQGIEEGSIDVQVTLWSDLLMNLLDDVEFLEYVTIS